MSHPIVGKADMELLSTAQTADDIMPMLRIRIRNLN